MRMENIDDCTKLKFISFSFPYNFLNLFIFLFHSKRLCDTHKHTEHFLFIACINFIKVDGTRLLVDNECIETKLQKEEKKKHTHKQAM